MHQKTIIGLLLFVLALLGCDRKLGKLTNKDQQLKESTLMLRNLSNNSFNMLKIEYAGYPGAIRPYLELATKVKTIFADINKLLDDTTKHSANTDLSTFNSFKIHLHTTLDTSVIWSATPQQIKDRLNDIKFEEPAILTNELSILEYQFLQSIWKNITICRSIKFDNGSNKMSVSVNCQLDSLTPGYYKISGKLSDLSRNIEIPFEQGLIIP